MISKFMLLFEATYPTGPEKFDEFLVKRAAGAKKIEKSARKKGGYSMLTAYHFAGKSKPYRDAKKWEKNEGKEEYYKQKAMEALDKLKDLDSLSQKDFQRISGEFEVYGEVYIRSTKEMFNKKQLEKGTKEELKDGHTTDENTAREIAKDHLKQKSNYYDILKKHGL